MVTLLIECCATYGEKTLASYDLSYFNFISENVMNFLTTLAENIKER